MSPRPPAEAAGPTDSTAPTRPAPRRQRPLPVRPTPTPTTPVPPAPQTDRPPGRAVRPPVSTVRRSGGSNRLPVTQPGAASASASGVHSPDALARFRFGDELGRGGMGVVRAAEDTSLRRQLAIKLLQTRSASGDEVEQFVEEAQITAQLEHPNIVPVHELGHDAQGRPWLAMKMIEGVSLSERIAEWKRRSRPLRTEDIHEILSLFAKVCDALAFAHSRRVIHRDIKPANIMVGSFGEVLLVDWGLARPLDAEDGRDPVVRSSRRETGSDLTMDGDVFGTPAFMPPEQAQGDVDQVDERSDIFSLGGVLYNMLTLEVPYLSETGASHTVVMAARHRLIPPRKRAPYRAIPRELEAIVLKAMAAEPRKRYRTVQALKDDLAAWQSLRPTTAWRAGPIERLVKLMRRNPTRSLTGVLVVVASLVVGLLLMQLQAADQARRIAEQESQAADQARQLAEREKQIAEEKRKAKAAEAERNRIEAEAAAERARQAEEMAKLMKQLAPEQVTGQRDEAIDAFFREVEAAAGRGMNTRRFIINMPEQQVRDYLAAFDRFERVAEQTDGMEMTADDFYYRAILKWKLRAWDDAIEDLTTALELDPFHYRALHWRGSTWLDKGHWEPCVADMDHLLDMQPLNVGAWLTRGHGYKVAGNLDEAFRSFRKAREIENDNVTVLVALGGVQMERGQLDEAEMYISQAIAIQPTHTEALGTRGTIRHLRGDHEGAIRDFNAVLKINPRFPGVIHNRGLAKKALGDIDGAIADYTRAIELDPRTGVFWQNRGDAFKERGETAKAMEDYSEGIRRDPRILATWLRRAALRAELQDVEGAVADCDYVIERQPNNWKAWYFRAVALQTTDRAATIEALQQAWRFCPDATVKQQLAANLRQLGAEVPE